MNQSNSDLFGFQACKGGDTNITPSRPKPDTDGLFSHYKAEALLQRIIHAVERHDSELHSFRSELDSSHMQITNNLTQLEQRIGHLEVQMESTIQRLETIERGITVEGVPMTVGECCLANRKTLVRTLNIVSKKVDSEELKEGMEGHRAEVDNKVEELKRDLASNVIIEKMNDATSALAQRVDVLADDVRNKVDKSLFKALSSEAASLKKYSDFVRTTEVKLRHMETSFDKINDTVQRHDEVTASLSDRANKLASDFDGYPAIDDFTRMKKDLGAVSQTISEKVDKQELTALCEHNLSAEERINILFASHEALAKHLSKRLDGTYTRQDTDKYIAQCLDKNSFINEIQKIKDSVESRATFHALDQLHQALVKVQQDMKVTKRKADLAAQFIALYGKDGG